jgi:hypothetical protein
MIADLGPNRGVKKWLKLHTLSLSLSVYAAKHVVVETVSGIVVRDLVNIGGVVRSVCSSPAVVPNSVRAADWWTATGQFPIDGEPCRMCLLRARLLFVTTRIAAACTRSDRGPLSSTRSSHPTIPCKALSAKGQLHYTLQNTMQGVCKQVPMATTIFIACNKAKTSGPYGWPFRPAGSLYH